MFDVIIPISYSTMYWSLLYFKQAQHFISAWIEAGNTVLSILQDICNKVVRVVHKIKLSRKKEKSLKKAVLARK